MSSRRRSSPSWPAIDGGFYMRDCVVDCGREDGAWRAGGRWGLATRRGKMGLGAARGEMGLGGAGGDGAPRGAQAHP